MVDQYTKNCSWFSSLQIVTLRRNSLETWPFRSEDCWSNYDVIYNLNYISIEQQSVDIVNDKLLPEPLDILYLSIVMCDIKILYSPNFHNMTNLMVLNISNNHLTEIASDLFRDLPELIILRIEHNDISVLHLDIFVPLTKLENLHLRGNDIIEITGGFYFLPMLSFLDLSNNILKTIREIYYSWTITTLKH